MTPLIVFRKQQFVAIEVIVENHRQGKSPVGRDGLAVVAMRTEMRIIIGSVTTDQKTLYPRNFHEKQFADFRNYTHGNPSLNDLLNRLVADEIVATPFE